jgi:hypothetical protein
MRKRRQTFEKSQREQALRARRERKHQRKEARQADKLDGAAERESADLTLPPPGPGGSG